MNRTALTILSLGLLATGAAQAEFKCDKAQLTRVDAAACAKAAEGIDSLARHVQRTRMVHGLYVMDYVRPTTSEQVAAKPATASAAPAAATASAAPAAATAQLASAAPR